MTVKTTIVNGLYSSPYLLSSMFTTVFYTHLRQVLPWLHVICQMSLWPFTSSNISSETASFTYIRNTTSRLFHKINSWRVQNTADFKTREFLKLADGCREIMVATTPGWYVSILSEEILKYKKKMKKKKTV